MDNILSIIKQLDNLENKFSDKLSRRENKKENRNYPVHGRGFAQRYSDNINRHIKKINDKKK